MSKKQNMPSFTANLSRHSHDTHAGYTSTLAPALIVPQYFDYLGPGDSVYYKTHAFARLKDMVTAFLGEIDVHLDYFFVPLSMLYTPFGQIMMQTDDLVTSAIDLNELNSTSFPLLNVINSQSYHPNNFKYFIAQECWGKSTARLLDALDANPLVVVGDDAAVAMGTNPPSPFDDHGFTQHPSIAPWFFAAYQCIYQKYFRNDDIEKLDIKSYNFDNHYDEIEFGNAAMLRLRYCMRPMDYFTSCRVSPIASAINALQGPDSANSDASFTWSQLLGQVNNFLGSSQFDYDYASNANPDFTYRNSFALGSAVDSSATLSAANVRGLFAAEKYLRIWGRADKTFDDQILAHFGYKVPHDVKHNLTHLKHYHFVLGTEPVYATSTTDPSSDNGGTVLGQVGGQSQASFDSDGEKFTAPVPGVFMCVVYCQTHPRYNMTFSKLHFLNTPSKFPMPEFDKLGMQPLYNFEYNPYFFGQNPDDVDANTGVFHAWQRRYQEFKQKYNRSSLAYLYKGILSDVPVINNVYAPWVLARNVFNLDSGSLTDNTFMNPYYLYETPQALNNVMTVPYNGDWSNDYFANPHLMFATDPIIFEFMCDCKKVSWMSESGEPDL